MALALCLGGTARASFTTDYSYFRDITVTNGGGVVANYFALVTVDTATLIGAGKMRVDGGDIRFSDVAENPLTFWVESGLNTAATRIWVVVPSLPNGVTTLKMFYGRPSATRVNQASDVFGVGVASLFTFTEGSGTTLHDWVGGHDMTITGLTWGPGFRAGVGSLSGFATGRCFRATSGPALGNLDFSAFIFANPITPNGSTQGLLGNYNNDGTSGWTVKLQGGAGQFMLLTNEFGNWCQASTGNIAANAWSMINATRDAGVENRTHVNGVFVGAYCAGTAQNPDNAAGPYEIGRSYNGYSGYRLDGNASLAAVYTTALSDAAVAALHTSLRPPVEPTLSVAGEQATNLAPVILAPASLTTCQDSDTPIDIVIVDSSPSVTVTLTTSPNGNLTLVASGGAVVTIVANTVTVQGPVPAVNATLASLDYRGDPGYIGPDTLFVGATDGSLFAPTWIIPIDVQSDAVPPSVSCTVARSTLWPATYGLLDAGFLGSAIDCGSAKHPTVTVYTDEAIGGLPYSPDASFNGTVLKLRAERSVAAGANGRIYLVVVAYTDSLGNPAWTSKAVVVPLVQTAVHIAALNAEAAGIVATFNATGVPPAGWATALPTTLIP